MIAVSKEDPRYGYCGQGRTQKFLNGVLKLRGNSKKTGFFLLLLNNQKFYREGGGKSPVAPPPLCTPMIVVGCKGSMIIHLEPGSNQKVLLVFLLPCTFIYILFIRF